MNVRQLAGRIATEQPTPVQAKVGNARAAAVRNQEAFARYLEQAQQTHTPQPALPLISSHAWQRIQQRGISMTEAQQESLGQAIAQLEAKGARDALLMREDAAFVVNVSNRTVVTAIGRQDLQDRIFTQIDSAMFV